MSDVNFMVKDVVVVAVMWVFYLGENGGFDKV